jgi:predicted metal-dependent phosphoesterase TrpH
MTLNLVSPHATVLQLKQILPKIGPESCPTQYNFHLHTYFSDGQMSPKHLVDQAVRLKLKGFAITDHHTVQGFEEAQSLLPEGGPLLWSGVEITTRLLGCEVHILGYGFDPVSPALKPFLQGKFVDGVSAKQVVSAIHKANGLAVLAHPFRYSVPGPTIIRAAVEAGVDGLEAYYAYKNPSPWIPSYPQSETAELLAANYGLYRTCGTDSHGRSILNRL